MPRKRKREEKEGESEGSFRAQYLTVGLTYSRSTHTKEELLAFLQSKPWGIEEYYIVKETHKKEKRHENDTDYHLHAWFKWASKPNIRNERFYDHDGHHPNIGKKSKNWIWNYLKKQDKEPVTNIADNYIELAKSGLVKEAIQDFQHKHPKEYAIQKDRVDANLKSLAKKERVSHVFEFTGDPPPEDWNPETHTLVVIGEAGVGKTEWAKSFITSLGETFLRVTHIDTLKEYDGQDWIIYDDVSFHHLPRETQIHIAEIPNERDIHCRNKPAHIPPGVKQIVVVNAYPFSYDPSIDRRVYKAPSIRFY